MWGIVAGVPVVALGAAYATGAFSTKTSSLDQALGPSYSSSSFARNPAALSSALQEEKVAFRGDTDTGGKRKNTKKSKSGNKKTKRRR
jgi:hypothetical protein